MSTIKSLEISNFQRVGSVRIEPTNNVIGLFGKNANGKTTVLDAIETTLCGFHSRITKRPIKDGHGRADIDIELTNGTILNRRFTPSGSVLTGKDAAGKKLGQKDLDGIISQLGVDAAAFINAGEKKQLETLLSVVDLPFVPAELDADRKRTFDERTAAGRDVKRLEAQLEAFIPMPADLPAEEVSLSELITQHHTATQQNQAVAQAHAAVASWQAKVDRLQAELAESERDLAAATAHAAGAPAIIDTDAIQLRINTAEVTNAQIRVTAEKRAVAAALTTARDTVEQLSADLAEIDQRKADGLAAAEMPVDGLSFDEEGVLYQGVPFSRASGAEQIIVSAAMIIATDPEVRTMVIRNGNVMDTDSLTVLQEMCEDNDFQAFVEFVSDSTDHEFRLVDGELAS